MKPSQRISTIRRQYPDQWVLVEITRLNRFDQAIAGRVLAHSKDEDEITRETIRTRKKQPELDLWALWTGDPIPHGMIVVLAGL